MIKKSVLILTFLCSVTGFSQTFNGYKYLVVPSKFAFQNQDNQYSLNALIEVYFKQQGFTVVYDKDLTEEMNANPCKAIYANVVRENNMFSTKIIVQLKDCQGKQLLISSEGSSKSKEYEIAHKEAIRMALKSIPNQNYVFEQDLKKPIYSEEKQPIQANIVNKEQVKTEEKAANNNDLFIVETLQNGYLLIDAVTSKVVLKLYYTSSKDIFIAVSSTKNGIVTRSVNNIIFEYIDSNVVKKEILNVKL